MRGKVKGQRARTCLPGKEKVQRRTAGPPQAPEEEERASLQPRARRRLT